MLRVLGAIEDRVGSHLRTLSHPLTPPPSLSIGTIRGGIATNVVPGWGEVTLDRPALPNETIPEAVAEVERVIADLQRADAALQADVEVIQAGPPIETSP